MTAYVPVEKGPPSPPYMESQGPVELGEGGYKQASTTPSELGSSYKAATALSELDSSYKAATAPSELGSGYVDEPVVERFELQGS